MLELELDVTALLLNLENLAPVQGFLLFGRQKQNSNAL